MGYAVGAIWLGQKLEKAAQKQTEKMRKSKAGICTRDDVSDVSTSDRDLN